MTRNILLIPSSHIFSTKHYSSNFLYPQTTTSVIERKNHNLLDVTRALLFHVHVPNWFWADVVLTACHLINLLPSNVLYGTSPHSYLFLNSPLFSLPLRCLVVSSMSIISTLGLINLVPMLPSAFSLVIPAKRL